MKYFFLKLSIFFLKKDILFLSKGYKVAFGEGREEVSENKLKEAGMGDGEECARVRAEWKQMWTE